MKKKTVALLMAGVLAVGCVIGGTLAWLTDTTDAVVNTFSTTDIEITLSETPNFDSDNDKEADIWKVPMVPGTSHSKDPVVAVDGDKTNVDCYLFVKFEENEEAKTYLTYTSNLTDTNGWALVDGETNVWYRVVKTTDTEKSWHLLDNDTVTINGDAVTKDNMDVASDAQLKYTAYACQLDKDNDQMFTPAEAWAKVKP